MSTPQTFDELIVELKHPRDWRVRQHAVKKLAQYETKQAMDAIMTALYDESPHVVQTASSAIAQYGSAAIPGLLEALHSEHEIADRPFILHALGKIGDP